MKKTLVLFFSLIIATTAIAKDAAKEAFYSAPMKVIPYAAKMLRMDMVDYYESGSDKKIRNDLYDGSRILAMTDLDIVIEETADSVCIAQIAVDLTAKGDTTYIFTRNIATPAIDGTIAFYGTDWKPLKGNHFKEPALKDWVVKGCSKEDAELVNGIVPFVMAKYDYDAVNKILTLTQNFDVYVPAADYEKVSHLLYKSMTYKWNGSRMILVSKTL